MRRRKNLFGGGIAAFGILLKSCVKGTTRAIPGGNTFCLLSLAFIFFSASALTQESNLNFINFNSKDGLSSSSVNDIIKDSYGYIWFAADDGLNKFDGANFTIYRHDEMDSTSIGGNAISAFYEDQEKNLWIGTNKGLSLYDRKKEAFINYDSFSNNAIRDIWRDHSGDLWVGGYTGLWRFNPRTGKIRKYLGNPGRTDQLLSNTVLCIYQDRQERIWIGTNAGLNLYAKTSDDFIRYIHSDSIHTTIADKVIRVISEDNDGNIWFGTDNGLSRLNPDGKSFINYRYNSVDQNTLSSNRIYAISTDKTGLLWIGTEEGLNIFDPATARTQRINYAQRNKYDFVGKSVRSIFIDEAGIYWIGTFHGGVNKFDRNLAFFNLRESNQFDPNGLSSPFVTSFVEDPKGNIYVCTDGGGLNLYNRKTGLFEHPELLGGSADKKLSILAMEGVGTDLWVGTYQQGLFVLNTRTGKRLQYLKGKTPGNITSNEIFCIKKDSKEKIWIGTNGAGVNVYDLQSRKFISLADLTSAQVPKVIINGFIRAIAEDKFGNIWIGSSGGGVAIYDVAQKVYKVLNIQNSNLPSNIVCAFYLDRSGKMWVGTAGGGLSLYNEKLQNFTTYSVHEGLSNSVIYKILEDNSGQLWVSTNKGLSSFNPQSRRFKNYTYQNGLQRSAFSLGAGLKTAGGEMFFGGLNGFNYFNPMTLHSNKNVPLLQLTALKISNRTVIPGDEEAIKEPISIAKEIRLDYKQNFSLDFIALNYTAPHENRYVYKLEGFDKDWNLVRNSPTANYTNLDPGNYVFRVKATSEDGSWSTTEKTIRIYVRPPLWRTGYAYTLYALVAIFIVVVIRYQAIHKLKNRYALEQERLAVRQLIEQERKEAERLHEFDQLKIRFLTNLSHEFRTPISLIVGPIEKLFNNEKSSDKKFQLSMVKRNANRLLNLVNQLLDLRKIEETELKLNLTRCDIVFFVKEIADSFKGIAEQKGISLSFTTALTECEMLFDTHKIERVLLNLLANAFKFTEKEGKIALGLEMIEKDSHIRITISDTGIGMAKEVRDKVFERFFQAGKSDTISNSGNGIGLSIAQEFVKLHGGGITVESSPGQGSTFTVQLPFTPIMDSPEIFVESNSWEAVTVPDQSIKRKKDNLSQEFTVLLVEDNDDFRQYLKDSLKPFYKIVEASDGREGWQKVLSCHPHVVVSDISMPHMDGISLSRKIKKDKRTSHIPVILLTAITGDANQLSGLLTGASDYLTKPFNFELLKVKISNLITLNKTFKNTYRKQFKVSPSNQVIEGSEDLKLIQKISDYIEKNIDSPHLNVEQLSKHLFMSRGSLYAKMVELTGETPVEFIRSLRLVRATALLEKSDMKIAQIAYAVGFSSPNHFARAFKVKFNQSPTEYLQQRRSLGNTGPVSAHSA